MCWSELGWLLLAVALWVGWQPATELGAVEPAAAEISFSNVQVREAAAGLQGDQGADHLQQRPSPRSASRTRHNPRTDHLQQRPSPRSASRTRHNPRTRSPTATSKPGRRWPAWATPHRSPTRTSGRARRQPDWAQPPHQSPTADVQVRESVPAVLVGPDRHPHSRRCAKHRERALIRPPGIRAGLPNSAETDAGSPAPRCDPPAESTGHTAQPQSGSVAVARIRSRVCSSWASAWR